MEINWLQRHFQTKITLTSLIVYFLHAQAIIIKVYIPFTLVFENHNYRCPATPVTTIIKPIYRRVTMYNQYRLGPNQTTVSHFDNVQMMK